MRVLVRAAHSEISKVGGKAAQMAICWVEKWESCAAVWSAVWWGF
jgi:hypothetical protein